MVDPINSGSPKPLDTYKAECQQSADLFKESLDKYAHEKDVRKRYEFEKVLEDSLKVMNEACRGLKKEEALRQEEKLEKDFKDYKSHPTPEKLRTLHDEADEVKHSI